MLQSDLIQENACKEPSDALTGYGIPYMSEELKGTPVGNDWSVKRSGNVRACTAQSACIGVSGFERQASALEPVILYAFSKRRPLAYASMLETRPEKMSELPKRMGIYS
jgi:hypothetical protein